MNINEIMDIYDDDDLERAIHYGETDLRIYPNSGGWVRLYTYYNWDNIFNEVLYFYEHNKKDEYYMAVSLGKIVPNKPGFLACIKKFTYDRYSDSPTLFYKDKEFDDLWEIEPEDLEESDRESFYSLIEDIFQSVEIPYIEDNALSKIK
jgi:hypothetical protein